MSDILNDLLLVFFRVILIIPLFVVVTLFMGKRYIAELPIIDFLVFVTLASVVGAELANPEVNQISTVFAVILIGIIQIIITRYSLRNRRFRRLISFEPTVVIKNGKFIMANLKRVRYSIDDLLQMLRSNNVFDIQDVELGIIEANGKLSVLKKPAKKVATIEDLGIVTKSTGIAYPIVIEGEVMENILNGLELNNEWLHNELIKRNVTLSQIIFASVNKKLELHIMLKEMLPSNTSPII